MPATDVLLFKPTGGVLECHIIDVCGKSVRHGEVGHPRRRWCFVVCHCLQPGLEVLEGVVEHLGICKVGASKMLLQQMNGLAA